MKITIDKDYTTLSQVERVKKDIQDFKHGWEESDLLSAFINATGADIEFGGEIIRVQGEAFPGGYQYNDETMFSFELIVKTWNKVYVLSFYCDGCLNIDTGDLLDYRGISTGQKMYIIKEYTFTPDK